jgi:ABC-type nickel/cobalt efflux system permease component RcnA
LLAVLWLIPVVSLAQNWGLNGTMDLMPLVAIGLLVLLGLRLFGQNGRRVIAYRSPGLAR